MFKPAEKMENLPFSGIRKILERANELQSQGNDIIHMEVGRPDFDTPEVIKEAAYESIRKGNVFYTSNYGTPALRKAVAEKLNRENGIPYTAKEILVTVGVTEATYTAMAAFLNPGDEILIPDPVWLNYVHVPSYLGAKPVSYHMPERLGFQIDLEQMASLINENTKMIVLNSPGNPTGTVQSRETLEGVAKLAREHNLLVISDEIYEKLIYDGNEHVSIASLPGMKERTITLNGFSKCYSMTGWRLGYAAAPEELIAAMVRVHQYANTCASSFVQEAAITALEKAEPDVQEMVKEYKRRRDYVVSAVNAIDGLSCHNPGGAFYLFVNAKSLGMTSEALCKYLLEEAKIATVPGSAFGVEGEGYLRISYACSYERLVEGMARLKDAVARLKA